MQPSKHLLPAQGQRFVLRAISYQCYQIYQCYQLSGNEICSSGSELLRAGGINGRPDSRLNIYTKLQEIEVRSTNSTRFI